jgi:NTP pyrophosphatase (non-canonical NTP hydrolase)
LKLQKYLSISSGKIKRMKQHVKDHKTEIADELVDVLYWVLLMSNDLKIDLGEAFYKKREEDDKKYPVEKVKGKHKKYTEYE